MSKHHYALQFRGDTIASFDSVYDTQALVVGYRSPGGALVLIDRYKTVKNAKRVAASLVDNYREDTPVRTSSGLFSPQAYSAFIIEVRPGRPEILDSEILFEFDSATFTANGSTK
jgi:hypothetical protein